MTSDQSESALRELLREVAASPPVFDDERVGYLEVQINRVTWDELQALRLASDEERP